MDFNLNYHSEDYPERKRLCTPASNEKFPGGNTILHRFVLDNSRPNKPRSKNCISAELISMSDVSVNARNDDGCTALHLAVLKNNPLMVRELISSFSNIKVNAKVRRTGWHRANGNTALHLASKLGHLSIVKRLLGKGADIETNNRRHETALCIAARSGHLDVVKLLVNKGARMNPVGCLTSPLCRAVKSGSLEAVEFLVSSGAQVNNRGLPNPISCAAQKENLAIAEFLLRNGADVNTRDAYGRTPLHHAVEGKSLELAAFLVDRGADLKAKSYFLERTPLHNALMCFPCNFDMIKLLLFKGADSHARDRDYRTPFHVAVRNGHLECVALLLDRGANLHAADKKGKTPLHEAVTLRSDSLKCVAFLLDRGADLHAVDREGRTPLHDALRRGNYKCADYLKIRSASLLQIK